ncbi:putative acid phosphatase [Coleophoma crateriformis]|uniref:Putative acid phosphatase n=1 Tax=Coleophoma crateriformis TaxID=565419 RepID=A0A3D8SNA7_9HELO|nr:putative acid phosphatase [Coleophoma crateriformis]
MIPRHTVASNVVDSSTKVNTTSQLTWTKALRMNQIQVIGTHNSYHREVSLTERPYHALLLSNPQDYYYSHAALDHQLQYQSVRGLELDIWADPHGGHYATPLIRRLAHLDPPPASAMNKSGSKIIHVSDGDVGVSCYTLVECLHVVKNWSVANPNHVPVPIMIEFKTPGADMIALGGATAIPWNDTTLLDSLDAEFRSVFASDQLITPDDIRQPNMTLEESILKYGWPDLDSARGRVMFLMDDGSQTLGTVRQAYITGRPSLEGRVIFTQSHPGEPDCAFRKMNTPTGDNQAEIQAAVAKNYWVRTRSDVPLDTILAKDTAMRDAAFSSGAQLISTDWPVEGMAARYDTDYVVRFGNGATARCNPVTAPVKCASLILEDLD